MKRIWIAVLLIGIAVSSPTRADELVKEFEGNNNHNTRPFTLEGPWELQWSAEGRSFTIYLFDKEGSLLGVPANQIEPGGGTSYQPRGGQYYLSITANGSWVVRVVKVE